ncbi:hypothetical protein EH223_20385 [candidate division KSB1 bacterium]|nr:four helix bundle protein [candidate division KSB1 bacterium]RQV99861.1 MAG: hypothetical protein EH223_20385 [candidate division KSB1 bacterium]
MLTTNTPAFDWSDVSDAASYELSVDNDNSFANPDINQTALTASNYTAVTQLADGSYYWRVRARDSQGNWGAWSNTFSFAIDTQGPEAPTLISPENNSTVSDNIPTFDWGEVSEPSTYELMVGEENSFATPEIHQTGLTATTYTPATELSETTYYWRVRAQDNNGNWGNWSTIFSFTIEIQDTSSFCEEFGTVTDIDGDVYQTVKIGEQWWMMENLKVTRYGNGDPIEHVTGNSQWVNLTTGAWCAYDNDPVNADTYGLLYNWYAVNDSRTIAPEGWHVPTDEEWKQLEMALGMSRDDADDTGWRGTDEGGKMKATGTLEAGTGLWYAPNTGATNESCFSALPGGYRTANGTFNNLGYDANFWSSTESSSSDAWYRNLIYTNSTVNRYNYNKERVFSSVRQGLGYLAFCLFYCTPRSGVENYFKFYALNPLQRSCAGRVAAMALYDELPVYKASYDLLLEIFKFTKNFAREYKYTIGESLKKETLELITLIYRANSKQEKWQTLQTAREHIEVVRLFVRLLKDLRQISLEKFVQVNKNIENVSKQLTGWQKTVKSG